MTSAQADALADHVLGKAGMTKGVCVVLGCGDGAFACALARRSGFVVHASGADAAQVATA